jgi:hypothetical protein
MAPTVHMECCPTGAIFPALFGTLVYPLCGLCQSATRFAKFLVGRPGS